VHLVIHPRLCIVLFPHTNGKKSAKEANDLMRSAEIDKTRLNALAEKNQTQVNEMVRLVSAKFTEIHDMLTPEQREKLVMIENYMSDKRHAGKEQEKAGSGSLRGCGARFRTEKEDVSSVLFIEN